MGADGIVLRHPASGAAAVLATSGWTHAGIVNAGDGTHEHPTQALLDAFTIRRRRFGDGARGRGLDGLRVVIVGDLLHSRVARSNLWLLTTLGATVRFVAPPTLMPPGIAAWPVQQGFDLDAALADGPEVVMMLRVQRERMAGGYFPSTREYASGYGLSVARAGRLPADSLVMHPGPMNRGLEIAGEVADSARSTVLDQVTNGIAVRMAVLYSVVAGSREAAA
jgi:aspartate carbamoyltransferase catalytic subunit